MGSGVHLGVHHIVEELSIGGEFHNNEYALNGLDNLVELGDRGVVCDFEDVQFAWHPLHIGHVLDFWFL